MDWCCSQISSSPNRLMPTGSSQAWTSAHISKKVCCWAGTSSSVPFLSLQILSSHKNHVKSSSVKAVATPPLKQQTAQDHAYRGLKPLPLDRHDGFSPAPSLCLTSGGSGKVTQKCFVQLTWYFTLKNMAWQWWERFFSLEILELRTKSKCWKKILKSKKTSLMPI